jgi:hypothetical protein
LGDENERLYLYAIVDHPPQWSRRGIQGAPVRNLSFQEIAAVTSPIDRSTISPTAKELLLHEAIIEELLSCCAVLPMRFGVVLAGEGAVLAALRTHYEIFAATLDHVRGRVELGLRVLWSSEGVPGSPPEQPLAPDSGRAYLLSRLERERQFFAWHEEARALADPIHSTLATLASDSIHQLLETPRLLLTAAYLLDREQVAGFQEAIQALQRAYTNLHFLCTGPWPAYSFARIAIWTEGGAR